jgi:hypothetical protein
MLQNMLEILQIVPSNIKGLKENTMKEEKRKEAVENSNIKMIAFTGCSCLSLIRQRFYKYFDSGR